MKPACTQNNQGFSDLMEGEIGTATIKSDLNN